MRARYTFIPFFLFLMTRFASAQNEAHALFTELLADHVQEGWVDYATLCQDSRLARYLSQLSATKPEDIEGQDSKLAFWLNAYNAFTLKIICDNYPLESIHELHKGGRYLGYLLKTTVWDKEFIIIHGKRLSLNDIEHRIIRPSFKEPRAHFALVCASISCPPLRVEAYEGYTLDGQLDDQGRIFLSQGNKNYFDIAKKEAHLSKIFDWFMEDFSKNEQGLLLFVSRFVDDNLAAKITAAPETWKIRYTPYDWHLNDTAIAPEEGLQ